MYNNQNSVLSNTVANTPNANVSVSTTSVTALASNQNRIQCWFTNTGSTTISLSLGGTAVAGTGIILAPNASVNFTTFNGAVTAISSASGGTLAVAEV